MYAHPLCFTHPYTGWKGTWVCEADKHKALEMYKVITLCPADI